MPLPIKSEHQEQVSFIHAAKKYFREQGNDWCIDLLFAIPNGGMRDGITAASLKMEGVRPGVPDIFFARPLHGKAGLFIEMKKSKGGRVSPEQKAMMDALSMAGYVCIVAHGCDEAFGALKAYLEGRMK